MNQDEGTEHSATDSEVSTNTAGMPKGRIDDPYVQRIVPSSSDTLQDTLKDLANEAWQLGHNEEPGNEVGYLVKEAKQQIESYLYQETLNLIGEDDADPIEMRRETSRKNAFRADLRAKAAERFKHEES